jgi:hypothetical protein
MAFGQQSGPPATAKQLHQLLELLNAAGHVDFRDARGPLGFTQRQAAGKFTRDEADGFIERLEVDAELLDAAAPDGSTAPVPEPVTRLSAVERTARSLSTEALAAELQRRGWIVVEP